jgi:hypothetical protein
MTHRRKEMAKGKPKNFKPIRCYVALDGVGEPIPYTCNWYRRQVVSDVERMIEDPMPDWITIVPVTLSPSLPKPKGKR